jgi:uncharacterized protein (DUF885 family)
MAGAALVTLAWTNVAAASPGDGRLLDETAYNEVARRRHFDLTRDQLIALGEQEYHRIETEITALARSIDPHKSWREIVRAFEQTNHPKTPADVIAAYEAEVRRARAFVQEKDLVTLPSAPDLAVRETPPNLVGSIAYAIYMFDDDVLLVTLGNGMANDDSEVLTTHNDGLIALASVHEAYPGHRTQNLIRPIHRTSEATETEIEGWGLYVEELMLRWGYYAARPPEERLFALRMLLQRAARAFLDPKIHRRDLSTDQAIHFLVDNVGVSAERARVEVIGRYVRLPGSAATYLVGKRQIEQLRRQVTAQEGSRFTLKRFHDRFLSAGAAPIQTIAREVFHTELDAAGVLRPEAPDRSIASEGARSARLSMSTVAVTLLIGMAAVGFLRFRRPRGRTNAGR